MHLLRSAVIGTEVIDDQGHQILGLVADTMIDPDRGKITAFFIAVPMSSDFLLQVKDISAWGNRIHIKSPEVMGPVEDFIRLRKSLSDKRRIIGQAIRTRDGLYVGKCSDIQFENVTFGIEWIFPKKFFIKRLALPASDIIEITNDAIIVKNQSPKREGVAEGASRGDGGFTAVAKPAVGRSSCEI